MTDHMRYGQNAVADPQGACRDRYPETKYACGCETNTCVDAAYDALLQSQREALSTDAAAELAASDAIIRHADEDVLDPVEFATLAPADNWMRYAIGAVLAIAVALVAGVLTALYWTNLRS